MPSITFDVDGQIIQRDITANQILKVQRIMQQINADRAAESPPQPAFSVNEYLEFVLIQWFQDWISQLDREDAQAVGNAYRVAAQSTKDQIDVLLGL